MARRKTQVEETLVNTADAESLTDNSEKAGNTEAQTSTEKQKSKSEKTAKEASTQDIPDNVLAVLKTFSNYPELLVTPHGCVYRPDCKLAAAQAAILYKNPFYNS